MSSDAALKERVAELEKQLAAAKVDLAANATKTKSGGWFGGGTTTPVVATTTTTTTAPSSAAAVTLPSLHAHPIALSSVYANDNDGGQWQCDACSSLHA
jgi:hypothetical protein